MVRDTASGLARGHERGEGGAWGSVRVLGARSGGLGAVLPAGSVRVSVLGWRVVCAVRRDWSWRQSGQCGVGGCPMASSGVSGEW